MLTSNSSEHRIEIFNKKTSINGSLDAALSFRHWLWLEVIGATLLLGAVFILPIGASVLLSVALLIVGSIIAFVRPFTGLILVLSIQPFIPIYKRLQFAASGTLQEFNNPISLLAQALIITITARLIWYVLNTGKIRRPSLLLLPALGLLSCYIVGIFYAPSFIGGIFGLRGYTLPFLLYFIGRSFILRRNQLNFVLIILASLVVALSIYGLKQAWLGYAPYEYAWAVSYAGLGNVGWFLVWYSTIYLRVFSTLSSPFEFAAVMMVAPLILLVVFQDRYKRLFHSVILLGVITTMAGLFVSGVRGAWIGCFFGLVSYLLLNLIQRPRRVGVAVLRWGPPTMGAIAIITLTFWNWLEERAEPLLQRIFSIRDPLQTGTMQMRYERWQAAFDAFLQAPLGTGTGSSGFFGQRFGNSNALIPDSIYIQALIEFGLPGLLLFIALFIVTIGVFSYRFFTLHNPWLRSVAALVISITVAIAVHGLTTPLQEGNLVIAWFWLLAGAGENLRFMDRQNKQAYSGSDR